MKSYSAAIMKYTVCLLDVQYCTVLLIKKATYYITDFQTQNITEVGETVKDKTFLCICKTFVQYYIVSIINIIICIIIIVLLDQKF